MELHYRLRMNVCSPASNMIRALALTGKKKCGARLSSSNRQKPSGLNLRFGPNSTVKLHLSDGSLPLDSFRAVRLPATEAVGPGADLAPDHECLKRSEQTNRVQVCFILLIVDSGTPAKLFASK